MFALLAICTPVPCCNAEQQTSSCSCARSPSPACSSFTIIAPGACAAAAEVQSRVHVRAWNLLHPLLSRYSSRQPQVGAKLLCNLRCRWYTPTSCFSHYRLAGASDSEPDSTPLAHFRQVSEGVSRSSDPSAASSSIGRSSKLFDRPSKKRQR